MRLLRFLPAFALVLVAAGCGADRNLTAPATTSVPGTAGNDSLAAADLANLADPLHGGRFGDDAHGGFVYTLGNAAGGNAVLAWRRGADGSLTGPVSTPTGGLGTGGGLGDQGALIASDEDGLLFAVDAGSHDIAVLRATPQGVRALGTTPSGGQVPISLTRHDDLLFVLNAGGEGNVTGFRILGRSGKLRPIPGSTRGLGGTATGPAQVGFTPDGRHLVVTEKAANAIVVYDVGRDGGVSAPHVQPSAGPTPFGFAFARWGTLVVSEAAGGAANASSASSYRVGWRGSLSLVSGPVPTHQTAACWVAVPRGGEFAYTTNAGTNNLSGYRVGHDGSLALLDADGDTAPADGTPIDAAFDPAGRFLYVLNGSAHSLNAYRRSADGRLAPMPGVSGLPMAAVGLATL